MKKTYKMVLMSAMTLFTLSATPLVLHSHLNVAQAATTKKTHHKKMRKHTTKKKAAKKLRRKKAKKHIAKKKAAKKLRYKKAKKHVTKKKAAKKFSYKKAKKHVTKKKLHYKKAKKAFKKANKKFRYKNRKSPVSKKISHKKANKATSKKSNNVITQNNTSADVSNVNSQSNLNTNSKDNSVDNNTSTSAIDNAKQSNSNSNYAKLDVVNSSDQNDSNIDDVNNYIKVPDDYPIKFVNGQYQIGSFPSRINSAFAINHFHANKQDKETPIDYNNLTYQQQKDLSQYTANIINNVRHQITNNNPTTADLNVDDNTINFVNDIAKRYDDDNWSIMTQDGHDVKAINQAAEKFGLNYSNDYNTRDDQQFYEDASAGYLHNNSKTHLSTIKQAIYNTIMGMLFNDADSQWGHAFNLLGNNLSGEPGEKTNTFAVGFDKLGQIHFETIPYDSVKANAAAEQADKINAAREISNELKNGITPHVSTDKPFNEQFAEFGEILTRNEMNKLESKGEASSLDSIVYDYYLNTVNFTDVEHPNGEKFKFDSNIQYNKHDYDDEVDNESNNGIVPHISPDQSFEKKFAEFKAIVLDNESDKLDSENKDGNMQYSVANQSITITDADYPNGKTFKFDPNAQLSSHEKGSIQTRDKMDNEDLKSTLALDSEVDDDMAKGIKPHISSDQPIEKQYAEFRHIFIKNEEDILSKEHKSTDVSYNTKGSTLIIQDANYPEGKSFKFDPSIKPIGFPFE